MKLSLLLFLFSIVMNTNEIKTTHCFELIEYNNVYTFLMDKDAFQSKKAKMILRNQKGDKIFSKTLKKKNQVMQFNFNELAHGQYWFYIQYDKTVEWKSITLHQ